MPQIEYAGDVESDDDGQSVICVIPPFSVVFIDERPIEFNFEGIKVEFQSTDESELSDEELIKAAAAAGTFEFLDSSEEDTYEA